MSEAGDSRSKGPGDYEVGYCRPPKHGQIKPGEVRGDHRRRKRSRSLKADIDEMLKMPVPITSGGKQRVITTRFAGLLKLREQALKGDLRALERLFEMAARLDEAAGVASSTASLLTEDEQILANARARAIPPEEPNDMPDPSGAS